MTAPATLGWHDANQHYLMARLALVREALRRHAARAGSAAAGVAGDGQPADETAPMAVQEATRALPAPSALDSLCASFGLSPFERDLLLLCAGMELDAGFGRLCAAAQGDPQRAYPTFSLALAALDEPHWSALPPAAPLRRWRFIEVGMADALTTSPLRIDERVLHYLTGASCLDARLQGLVEPLPSRTDTPPSHRSLAEWIAQFWSQTADASGLPVINLCGEDHPGKQMVAAASCAFAGTQLYLLQAADVPAAVAEREALSRLWERETALIGCALLLDADDGENTRAVVAFLENVRAVLLVSTREPLRLWRRQVIRLDVDKPTAAEQRQLWRGALGPVASQVDGQIETLVSQFNMGVQGIRAAGAAARPSLESAASGGFQALWDACRAQARARLDDLAQRIEPVATWDDLVLPEAQRNILRDIVAHVRRRARVHDEWGFAGKGARGLGISALFAGASGTGKTMAAEVLASELRLDLYRIDLSQVVSKFIGETEKNLRRVFDTAEEGGAILLFDEADALFGKRTEVKDSHDRYANIEISYLLQRMETYRGLAILTTNIKSVLDTAFLRRLRFIVPFPFPDAGQRAVIWRRVFPAATPTENLDPGKLARLNVAGGNIRNIALHAAFLAADTGEPVRMFHLLRAARSEYAKLEKSLTEAEIAQWV
jgi:hypothetical protein